MRSPGRSTFISSELEALYAKRDKQREMYHAAKEQLRTMWKNGEMSREVYRDSMNDLKYSYQELMNGIFDEIRAEKEKHERRTASGEE
ncbi:hypothetical protein D1872_81820 [compost metagenome]